MAEKAKVTPGQFIQQVRQEVSKVTWPKRKEVAVTSAMVMWMVFIISLFLVLVDFLIQHGVKQLLGLFS